jgi:hypothetical protein
MTTSDVPTARLELGRFLDDLLVRHPPLEQAVSDFARRAGRVVAVRAGDRRTVVADPVGALTTDWPDAAAAVGTPRGLTVALGAPATPDDEMLLERLAVLTVVLLDRESLTVPGRSQAQMVALLIDPATNPTLRSQTLLGLGLRSSTSLRAFTVAGAVPAIEAFATALVASEGAVLTATRSRTTVLLRVGDSADLDRVGVPRGLQVGASQVHPASAAPVASAEADGAFRFSQPSPRDHGPYRMEEGVLVRAENLNGYDVLAEALTPGQISRLPDVQALDQVLALGGTDMLSTLDVVVTASIRQAARALGVHHNSVQHRVAQAERVFGFGLSDVYGRNRLFLALTLRRIRQTHGMV